MVQNPLTRSLGDLTVDNGATKSNALLAAGELEKMESLQVAAPATLGLATTATVESLDQVGGSAWGNHLSDGSPINLLADERVTITDIPLAGVRIALDIDPGEDVAFAIVGKLSKQGLAREGIGYGPPS